MKAGRERSVGHLLAKAVSVCESTPGLLQLYEAAKSRNPDVAVHCLEKLSSLPETLKDASLLAWVGRTTARLDNRDIMDPLEPFEPFKQLVEKRGFSDARQILYAHIDLNTVDGSAIWMSSMASMLAQNGKVIIISKNHLERDVIIKNITNRENVLILTPGNVRPDLQTLDIAASIRLVRALDHLLPKVKSVFIRGLAAACELLSDRQFYKRSYIYLTDLYEHRDNQIVITDLARRSVDVLARQSAALLVQTPQLENLIRTLTRHPFKAIMIPPPIPDTLFRLPGPPPRRRGSIRIGYAGKIAPNWGIRQLIKWVGILQGEGMNIEVTIIGDKISGAATNQENRVFRQQIVQGLERIKAHRLGALDRASAQEEMQKMDFAWCWRPAEFEEHTLELSTKLIEGVASALPGIAYPNGVNRETLGKDYPFFVRDFAGFRRLLNSPPQKVPSELRTAISKRHSIGILATRLVPPKSDHTAPFDGTICFAAHDPKFIFPYYSDLKSRGAKVVYDPWEWGGPTNEQSSREIMSKSQVVFCEWGLANSVWYSKNLRPGPKLIVRVHLQEIKEPGKRFGNEINHARVDRFIFVSELVRQEYIRMFDLPREKTCIVNNFILENEYLPAAKSFSETITLGMVGIIPKRKRLDRAVRVLDTLIKAGHSARLVIKGPRPETIDFMTKGHRRAELDYYYKIYSDIESDPDLKAAVEFHGWGNDVAKFYDTVDHILSPSDFESFHYALADGVLSGCHPVVWDWTEAEMFYHRDWVVANTDAAVAKILQFRQNTDRSRAEELTANRDLVVSRYGSARIFGQLDAIMF
ncbi:MAG: glycosyltransferase [Rhodobacteraceae bacterium]|nr:glycosyltransferase [Paracoccaceae bacterium]